MKPSNRGEKGAAVATIGDGFWWEDVGNVRGAR